MNTLSAIQARNGLWNELSLVARDEACNAKDAQRRMNELQGLTEQQVVDVYFGYHPEMREWAEAHIEAGTCEDAIAELRSGLQKSRELRARQREDMARMSRMTGEELSDPPSADAPDWMKPFMLGPARVPDLPQAAATGEPLAGHAWPQVPLVIEHIRKALKCTPMEARIELQRALHDGRVQARGPLAGSAVRVIDQEFWRYAIPDGDEQGGAINPSTRQRLPWFELRAAEVLAIWPEHQPQHPAPKPTAAPKPPFNAKQAKALLIAQKMTVWPDPPNEKVTAAFLRNHFSGIPSDPHRNVRREVWKGQVRAGRKPRKTAAD